MSGKSGVKKGCVIFLIVLAALAAGAGLSVLIRGKYLKPKGRLLLVTRPARTLDKIRGEFAPDVSESLKKGFEDAYGVIVREMTEGGAQSHDRLVGAAESLQRIRSDGKITVEEAKAWIEATSRPGAANTGTLPKEDK